MAQFTATVSGLQVLATHTLLNLLQGFLLSGCLQVDQNHTASVVTGASTLVVSDLDTTPR
jgi:hypothetical protein